MIGPHLSPLPQGEEAGFAAGEGSVRLFASLNVYRDVDFRSAAMNMAVDEALLEVAIVPSIRFYRWDHPALSFGYFGKFAEVAEYRNERELVRRWTGGGIVFHGEDLTYSIIIPSTDRAFAESSTAIYEKVHRALCNAFAKNGHAAELAAVAAAYDRRDPALIERRYSNCFENPVRADVMLNGQKVAGAAQRRTRRGLLHQGSIQQAPDSLVGIFGLELSSACRRKPLDPALLARAEEIAEQKYGSSAWLQRR